MKLYDTLRRSKEEFVPQHEPIQMYVCGVTPYADCHVGHGMSYITFDVLRRYLEWQGYKVLHVQNFTDIDDKIIQRASDNGRDPKELAEELIEEYFNDMDSLNVQRTHIYPRATDEIDGIINMVSGLIEKGFAYQIEGDVYYRVQTKDDYGKLGHRSLDGMMSGSRVEIDPRKEHPMDFALWKAAKPGEPSWDSPWGAGRPGWHMECSAMSLRYLSETLDIHGGGQDLIFPHHENEIAQTEAYTGVKPFVNFWIHHGLLRLGEEKMSKSLGNLVTIKEVLAEYSADALRLFVLGSHYRGPLTYSDEALAAAHRGAARLRAASQAESSPEQAQSGLDLTSFRVRFTEAMDDDLNTAQAIASLFELATEINRGTDKGSNVNDAVALLKKLAGVLGLTLMESKAGPTLDAAPFQSLLDSLNGELQQAGLADLTAPPDTADSDVAPVIDQLILVRAGLRKAKRFDLADKVRKDLSELGVTLEDSAQGTTWKQR